MNKNKNPKGESKKNYDMKAGDRVRLTIEGQYDGMKVMTDDGRSYFEIFSRHQMPGIEVEVVKPPVILPTKKCAIVAIENLYTKTEIEIIFDGERWKTVREGKVIPFSDNFIKNRYIRTIFEGV